MTPAIFERLLPTLRTAPVTLSHVHALVREAGSTWSREQLRLFLTVAPGIRLAIEPNDITVSAGQASPHEALLDAVITILRAREGGPLHPDEIRRLLPAHFQTSTAQLKALTREHHAVRLFGPGLIQLTDHA